MPHRSSVPRFALLATAAAVSAVGAGCTGDLGDASEGGAGTVEDGVVVAPARRLSASELANTYSAVVGIVPEALAQLPPDARDHVFDRVFESQTISALHLETYGAMSREAFSTLLNQRRLDDFTDACPDDILPPAAPETSSELAGIALAGTPDWAVCHEQAPCTGDTMQILYANECGISHQLQAVAGTYRIRLELDSSEGGLYAMFVDEVQVAEGSLPVGPTSIEVELSLQPGTQSLRWDFNLPGSPLLRISGLNVTGPLDPGAGSFDAERDACAYALIDRLAPSVYRRPLRDGEAEALEALYDQGRDIGGFGLGARTLFEAMLQSPHFLYLVEQGTAKDRETLTPFELASRLSYALTEAPPDGELWAAAEDGSLSKPAVLAAQAERLLATPAGQTTVARFFAQWFRHDQLPDAAREPTLYPAFTADVRAALQADTRETVRRWVFDEGLSLPAFFTARNALVSPLTAPLYGVQITGSEPAWVDLPEHRAGVLTLPATLAVTSKFDHSSPVGRGVFVLEDVLCQTVQAPPQNVDITPPPFDPNATTRERFAQHVADPACSSCHAQIDPAGFALEDFDAAGAYRIEEAGKPVDASGGVPSLGIADGSVHGGAELAHAIAGSEELASCFARQWARYARGRLDTEDAAELDTMSSVASTSVESSIEGALLDVVTSESFRLRRYPGSM